MNTSDKENQENEVQGSHSRPSDTNELRTTIWPKNTPDTDLQLKPTYR